MEAAAKRTKELKENQQPQQQQPSPVFRVDKPHTPRCTRCGCDYHDSNECKFKDATCHKCGRLGHIAPVCRSRPGKFFGGQPKQARWVSAAEQDQEESLYVVREHVSSSPYQVELHVNGQPLTLEVDPGAGVSLIPESVWTSLLPSTKLQKASVVLKSITGQQIHVKGSISVDVDYDHQHHKNLKLLAVEGAGPCLMGRDWLGVVKLDWRTIGKISTSEGSLEDRIAVL